MATIVKDLGAATAYGYAVEKGYTGTEEEFAELMASYASVAESAADSASAAAQSATNASDSAAAASTSATSASTSATTASTKAGEAETYAAAADGSASAAGQSVRAAGMAQTAAEAAQTAAVSARDAAVAAQGSAESSATAAAQSATAAAASEAAAREVEESIPADYSELSNDVSDLKSQITHIDGVVYYENTDIQYVIGQITSTGGVNDASQTFVRTRDFIHVLPGSTVYVDNESAYKFNVAFYSGPSTSDFVSFRSSSQSGEYVVASEGYIRFSIAYKNDTTVSDTTTSEHFVLAIFESTLKEKAETLATKVESTSSELAANVYYYTALSSTDYVLGKVISNGTVDDSSRQFVRSHNFIRALKGSTIAVDDEATYNFNVAVYSSDSASSFVSIRSITDTGAFIMPIDGYVRFSIGYKSGAILSDTSIASHFVLNIRSHTIKAELAQTENTVTSNSERIGVMGNFTAYDTNGYAFEQGGITRQWGEDTDHNARIRTDYIYVRDGSVIRTTNKDYQFAVFEYCSNTSMLYTQNQLSTTWTSEDYTITNVEVSAIRIAVKNTSGSTLSATDIANAKECIHVIMPDESVPALSVEKIPSNVFWTDTVEYDGASDMTYAEIIAGYDALVSNYPDYVSKSTLGKDSSGNYDIYQYVFEPKSTPKLTPNFSGKTYSYKGASTTWLPTIILEAGVHGGERPIVRGLLNAMTKICTDWQADPILAYLRFNYRIVVNPCATPFGYVTRSRFNANDVNINRNFNGMDSWQYGSDVEGNENYRGTAPLSEVEAQYIYNTLSANSDAVLYHSYHTYGMMQTYTQMMCWAWATYVKPNEMYIAGENVLKQISRNAWSRHNYPYSDGNYIGTMQASNGIRSTASYRGGYTDNQGNAFGIPSACPEGIYQVYGDDSTANSHDINCLNAEFVIITVIEALKQLI